MHTFSFRLKSDVCSLSMLPDLSACSIRQVYTAESYIKRKYAYKIDKFFESIDFIAVESDLNDSSAQKSPSFRHVEKLQKGALFGQKLASNN